MYSKLEKDDKTLLKVGCLIIVVFVGIVFFATKGSGLLVTFWIPTLGTGATLLGLIFALHLQAKLKTTAQQIQEKTNILERTIGIKLHIGSVEKALASVDAFYDSLQLDNLETAKLHLRNLHDLLTNCKRNMFINYDSELTKRLNEGVNISIQTVDECKDFCKIKKETEMDKHIEDIGRIMVEIGTISPKKRPKSISEGMKFATDVRQLLREIQQP